MAPQASCDRPGEDVPKIISPANFPVLSMSLDLTMGSAELSRAALPFTRVAAPENAISLPDGDTV